MMDVYTVVEESARNLFGLSYLLSKLSGSDNMDDDERHMYGLLSDVAYKIGNNLQEALNNRE